MIDNNVLDYNLVEELRKKRYDGDKLLTDSSREYELALTKFDNNDFNTESITKILEFYQDSKEQEQREIAYSAFFALIIHYRHQYDYNGLNNLWETYHSKFTDFDSYNHLQILHFLFNLKNSEIEDEKKYLNMAKANIEKYRDNPGINHALADLFASICEKYENAHQCFMEFKDWYGISFNAANIAIEKEPETAVFNCTKGRIFSIFNNYDDADREFNIAIAKEISNRTDRSLRIGKYQYYKLLNQIRNQVQNVQTKITEVSENINGIQEKINEAGDEIKVIESDHKKAMENYNRINADMEIAKNNISNINTELEKANESYGNIKTEMEKTKDEMRESRVSSVEMIGIFSGVVSFIIGALSITNKFSAIEAGFLILTLMGCLAGALTVFSLLLHGGYNEKEKNKKRIPYIIIIACSLFLAIGSIFAMKYFSPSSETNNISQNTSVEDSNASSDF